MSVVCEFELVSAEIPLTTVAADLDAVLRVEHVISGTHGPPALVFSAPEGDADRLESRLAAADTLAEFVTLESGLSESQYRVTLEETSTDAEVYRQLVDRRTHPTGATVTGRGWTVRAQFADRTELAAFREACQERNVGFRLLRLSERDAEGAADYGLTTAQHEALLVAFEMGYFEVPREATLSDIAVELDTTTSALSERLRRGQGQLIARTIRATNL